MTLTQILQKIRSAFYTKAETDTLLSGKSNDSDVVHKNGDETINGVKTFTSNINYPNGFLTSVMDNDFRISQYSGYGNGNNFKIIIQNTDGKVWAPNGFKGNLQGNADTATKATSADSATKATKDSDGNQINTTYAKKILMNQCAWNSKANEWGNNYIAFTDSNNARVAYIQPYFNADGTTDLVLGADHGITKCGYADYAARSANNGAFYISGYQIYVG